MMALSEFPYASQLRQELTLRNRRYACGRAHVETYGNPPVIVYAPEQPSEQDFPAGNTPRAARHGNFFDAAYAAITAHPEWMRRFDKIHAQGRALPKAESGRRWRELDSSMSSDALLMNVICAPGVAQSAAVRNMLGIEIEEAPAFGFKARVPLTNGRFDRTEVDMRWGSLLVEAKLTEADFQTRESRVLEGYRDFDAVFDRDLLPRVELRTTRRLTAVEFAEEFTQEWEDVAPDDQTAREFQNALIAQARQAETPEPGYSGYQLIRNVLAANALDASFCVIHDARRPDLREAWFQVIAAVKPAAMRVRCQVLTWQELAATLPEGLQEFLNVKYGIVAPGQIASPADGLDDSAYRPAPGM